MYCPLIKKECIKEKCKFWQGFWNEGKQIFDCVFRWQNILIIELKGIFRNINLESKNNQKKE